MARAQRGSGRESFRWRLAVVAGAALPALALASLVPAAAGAGAGTRPPGRGVSTGAAAHLAARAATEAAAELASEASRPGSVTRLVLPPAVAGRPYFDVVRLPGTTGGRARPASWRPVAGALPAGLRFDAAIGAVLGLPQRAGTGWLALGRAGSSRSALGGAGGLGTAVVDVTVSAPARALPEAAAAAADVSTHRGSISGTVTAAGGPLARVCVTALDADGRQATTLTISSGHYQLNGLVPGKWEVLFEGCANDDVGQWWPDQATQTTARAVTVTSGAVRSGISAELRPGGAITGRVTVAESGFGAPSVCVYAGSAASINGIPTVAAGAAATDVSGAYSINGLPAGSYEVVFAPCTNRVDLQQIWWDDQSDPAMADGVSVTAGETTVGISPALEEGGEISGTISAASSGRPLAGMCAEAISANELNGGALPLTYVDGRPVGLAETGSDGSYTITGLATGNYLVEFLSCVGGAAGNYLPAIWHEAKNFPATPTVAVTAGSTTSDISARLAGGGSVSGRVTAKATKRPLGDICVAILSPNSGAGSLVVTGSDGRYDASGLATGRYVAIFEPCGDENLQGTAWHRGASFRVRQGATTKGISAELSIGGTIEGKVETTGGGPLTGLCLIVSQTSSSVSFLEEFGPEGFGGLFSLTGLTPGAYSVGFAGCESENYLSVLWKHGHPVHVKAGQVVSGVRLELPRGGEITGTVTDSGGTGLSAMCVGVASDTLIGFGESYTFEGHFLVDGLPTGHYTVGAGPCYSTDNYLTAVRGGLVVTAGAVTSGVSLTLATGAEISGTVTDTSDQVLSFICVTAIPAFSQDEYETLSFGGSYALTGLGAGTYEIEFQSCYAGTYLTQWWQDAASQAKATIITLTAGQEVTGVDAELTP